MESNAQPTYAAFPSHKLTLEEELRREIINMRARYSEIEEKFTSFLQDQKLYVNFLQTAQETYRSAANHAGNKERELAMNATAEGIKIALQTLNDLMNKNF